MDATAAMVRMSELEDRLRKVTQERNNYAFAIVNYEAFIKRIPRSMPGDLDPETMTPNTWLDWAIQELGYENAD